MPDEIPDLEARYIAIVSESTANYEDMLVESNGQWHQYKCSPLGGGFWTPVYAHNVAALKRKFLEKWEPRIAETIARNEDIAARAVVAAALPIPHIRDVLQAREGLPAVAPDLPKPPASEPQIHPFAQRAIDRQNGIVERPKLSAVWRHAVDRARAEQEANA